MSTIKKGDKFNRLTAVRFDYRDKKSELYWLFKCECGTEKVILVSSVKRGDTKACGCLNKTHGMTKTRTFKSWSEMKQRCLNKNRKDYKYWGGRGITVCLKWLDSFENFYADMGKRPEGKTLDRIKNDKGYYKKNCRWATSREQNNNRRDNHFLTYDNKTQTIAQWSEELNIKYYTIYMRLRRGWSVGKVLNTNSREYKSQEIIC